MYKTPPQDDQQPEYPEYSYPVRRRKHAASKRPSSTTGYHSDEHPEVPKIKRASLRLDKQHISPQQERARQASPPHINPTPAPTDEETDQEAVSQNTHISEHPTQKIMMSPNWRHRSIYLPSSKTHLSRHRPTGTRQIRSYRHMPQLLTQLEQWRHNPAIIIIGILALIILIIVPIILNAGHTYTTVTQNGTSNDSGQPATGAQAGPANIHELLIIPQDTDHPAPPVFATSAYLLDADTGVTLYAYNPFMHLPMLSTTKLMTAALAIQQGNLDQRITINDAMARDISYLSADSALFGVKQGEIYTLRDLIYGLLFVSGNDAAIVIADALAGNLHNFVAEMNQQAHQLGLYDTHFMNPHGLLATGQFSSAHDLALLGRYSMSLPVLHKISGETVNRIPQGGNHPERILINENQFLWWYPGVEGGKTGYDGQSDFIQVMLVTHNHHRLIGVVMHTNNWWTDMRDLMNWGFDSFNWVSPHDLDSPDHPIPFDDLWGFFARDKKENTIPTADQGRYYIYTGFSISGPIMAYFDKNGGLKAFGYPTRMPVASSGSSISQQFEHGTIQCDLTANSCQTG